MHSPVQSAPQFRIPDGVLKTIEARAASCDAHDGTLQPDLDILRSVGALAAPLPVAVGGFGTGTTEDGALPCLRMLRDLGAANLSVARLIEGHVNAIRLGLLYGSPGTITRMADDVRNGLLLGVWGADGSPPLRIENTPTGARLSGVKRFASGLGVVGEAVVTVSTDAGPQLLLVPVAEAARGDLAAWRVSGMRATRSGTYTFDNMLLGDGAFLGAPGDYVREPHFEGGVWRYCAAHLGGAEALYRHMLTALASGGRASDPHQERRIFDAASACETARLWLERAALRVECGEGDPEAAAAYALCAREATQKACLTVIDCVQEALGMGAYDETRPVDRIRRDLGLFLRQAAPDAKRSRAAKALVARQALAEAL